MDNAQIISQIFSTHNDYLQKMHTIIAALGRDEHLKDHERIDRVMFHVIEEIVELRRTYPHKFWKQAQEETDKIALLEEAADIFLMFRSGWLEVCKVCGVTEQQFLEAVLAKAKKNQVRLASGY